MRKWVNGMIAVLAAGTLTIGIAACERHEGPAERAGKEIDKAMEKTGQQIEKAGDAIQETARGERK
jgi:hypothetical protein